MAASHAEVWQRARVIENVLVADSARRITLEPDVAIPVKPGEHVTVRIPVRGVADTRSFSIVDAEPDGSRFALTIFLGEQSRGGSIAMHALEVGDSIELTQPLQDFPLALASPQYVFLAGGIGITAIAGMAAAVRARGADYLLVYAGRTRTAMPYLDELAELHGDRLEVHVRDELTSLIVTELVASIHPETELYMCGPIRLMDAVRREWLARRLPEANLRFETFGNSGWYASQEFVARIPGFEVVVGPSQSMLEALEAAGADLMYDCRKGECGLCEVRIIGLEGVIDHRDVFYSERQKDATTKMCCCVSRVVGGSTGRATISVLPS